MPQEFPQNVPQNAPKISIGKGYAKSSSMVVIKMSHVTCVTFHMSQMLHVTNIKFQTVLPNTQFVIYFWNAHAKSTSMVAIKMSHVTFATYHMSQMLHVTNIKIHVTTKNSKLNLTLLGKHYFS